MLNAEVLSRAAAPQRDPDVEGGEEEEEEDEEEEDEEVDEQTVSWGRFAYSISLIGLALGAVVLFGTGTVSLNHKFGKVCMLAGGAVTLAIGLLLLFGNSDENIPERRSSLTARLLGRRSERR